MSTVTISKTKYEELKRRANAFRAIASGDYVFVARDDVKDVIKDFEQTGLYSKAFLRDLEKGLRKSSVYRNRKA